MHEMSIADSILQAVRAEAARHPGGLPRRVAVRIGTLAGIDPSALEFCFEALVRETDLAGLALEVVTCPRRHRCSACGVEFEVVDYDFQCPDCGEMRTECVSGAQLELAWLEMEQHATATP
jgi:hydrogenase nickel incorporation protein HypA/HybF